MTPSSPNAASTYPVRTTSNPKRRDAKSANVVVHTANEHQYTKSAINSGRRCARPSTSGSARSGDTETALPRWTVSGSHSQAMAAATAVTAAAAQMGAV